MHIKKLWRYAYNGKGKMSLRSWVRFWLTQTDLPPVRDEVFDECQRWAEVKKISL